MIQCPHCGALVPEERSVCPNCGERIPADAVRAPVRPTVAAAPAYSYNDPGKARDAVLSTGGFVGSVLLLSIPGLGLLMKLIWSCGGCRNHNRRNLARAYLILWLFFAVLVFGAVLILRAANVDLSTLFPAAAALFKQ